MIKETKKESFETKIKKRKELVKKMFLKLVKEHDDKTKFDYNKYICGTGGKGILAEALGAFNPYDKKIFQEVLSELVNEDVLYHIGGAMYTLTK